jgi:hypothetical protein
MSTTLSEQLKEYRAAGCSAYRPSAGLPWNAISPICRRPGCKCKASWDRAPEIVLPDARRTFEMATLLAKGLSS